MSIRGHTSILLAASLVVAAGCAGTPKLPPDAQAISDYVEVGELEEVDSIRTDTKDAWSPATDYYVLYKGRDGHYLLEFVRVCWELTDGTRIKPDLRYSHNMMRRGSDTLRGCRIDKMYPLTEAQAQEIEVLAKIAGEGN